ncbi:MAG: hypothetical protein FWB71_03320 [Defluviitaleaceae bacterium]|nr:hypothetical protein [Defluviitaleaceae bacterium]
MRETDMPIIEFHGSQHKMFDSNMSKIGLVALIAISIVSALIYGGISILLITSVIGLWQGFSLRNKIRESYIRVFENRVEGAGLEGNKLSSFHLRYCDIFDIKARKWGIKLRTTQGNFRIMTGEHEHYMVSLIEKRMGEKL